MTVATTKATATIKKTITAALRASTATVSGHGLVFDFL